MRLLTNPIVLRMALVFLAGAFSFAIGVIVMRRMRRNIGEEVDSAEPASLDSLPLHTYHAVIQQLKQQKHELQSSQQVERRRARTSENISAAVLSHLSSGVMFIDSNGLVRQANTAARQILGFASPVGMGLKEVFREAAVDENSGPKLTLAETVQHNLRDKTSSFQLDVHYLRPSGEERSIEVTVTPVQSSSGDTIGAACLINDQTELARVQQQQAVRREISAEKALELRNSLATIADCAKRLSTKPDEQSVQLLASDIALEAAHLDRTIGGFLAEPKAARAAAGFRA